MKEKLKEYGFIEEQISQLLKKGWVKCSHGFYELKGNVLKLTRRDGTGEVTIL